jgi:uncharacterized protein YecE (DUF72 family)
MTDAAIGDLFAAPQSASSTAIRCGIGGWVFPAWRDNFYPAGLVQRRELEYASRHLRTIEINSTYYRAQPPSVYAKWVAQTPAGFVFSLKAPRLIVERRALATSGKAVHAFLNDLQAFGDRLGPIVWQLTPSRVFDADDLAGFLDQLPRSLNGKALRHVLEVRHDSFLCHRYLELARSQGLPSVYTDSPTHPSFADLTGDVVYARLMRSRSTVTTGYPAAELDTWAQRAKRWAEGGDPPALPHVQQPAASGKPREVFVFFIGADKERNPAAAMALQARLDG